MLGIVNVSAELTILPEKICFAWSATRDVALRKFYLPNFYRYGLDFKISCNNTTSLICILLCGDVVTNPGPSKQFKCVTLNSRSLKSLHKTATGRSISNIQCFQDLVYSDDIDVVCVNETWLNGNISSLELLNDNFTIYHKDCTAQRAGGVLIAVRNDSFKSVKQYFPTSNEIDQIEIVSVELTTHREQKVLFSSCYRPPNSGSDWVDMFNIFLNQVSDQFDKVVISGDFNMPHIPWINTGDAPSAHNSFIEALNDHFLTQINNIPTRNDNMPEHVNITDVEIPSNAAVFTDHCVLHYEFNAFVKTAKSKTQRLVYNYKKGDFNGLCSS